MSQDKQARIGIGIAIGAGVGVGVALAVALGVSLGYVGVGAEVGAVGQHRDHRHPLARQGRPHPPADAPPKGPHGDAGGGGLPRQPLPGG